MKKKHTELITVFVHIPQLWRKEEKGCCGV